MYNIYEKQLNSKTSRDLVSHKFIFEIDVKNMPCFKLSFEISTSFLLKKVITTY